MKSSFKVPNAEQRKLAVGKNHHLSQKNQMIITTLMEVFQPIPQPKNGDWLYQHKQIGQSFSGYEKGSHNSVSSKRNTIYIQPLQKQINQKFLSSLQGYCSQFFYSMKVKIGIYNTILKNVKSRINENTQKKQYHANQILSQLRKIIPQDAFCLIGVSITDLYPRQSWNFVFGLASLADRVGVFSFARYDPRFYQSKQKYQIDYSKILWSSAKVMTHQICHMFGMLHCIYYSCLMNGSNTGEQGSKKPRELCPVCLKKLQINIKFDLQVRYFKILKFLETQEDSRNQSHIQFLKKMLNSTKFVQQDLIQKQKEMTNHGSIEKKETKNVLISRNSQSKPKSRSVNKYVNKKI